MLKEPVPEVPDEYLGALRVDAIDDAHGLRCVAHFDRKLRGGPIPGRKDEVR